jgi:hypothetical protein
VKTVKKETKETVVQQAILDQLAQQDLQVTEVLMEPLVALDVMVLPEQMVLMDSQEQMENVDHLDRLAVTAMTELQDKKERKVR